MKDCERKNLQWASAGHNSRVMMLQCVNRECKLHDHCGRNHYEQVTACTGCVLSIYPPCDKKIPCCKCMEEDCNSRQPCEKGIV